MADHFDNHKELNLLALKATIECIIDKGGNPILFEQPHIDNESVFAEWRGSYSSMLNSITAEYGIPYVNLNDEVNLDIECFNDVAHVSAKGREIWSVAFINWLNGLLSSETEQ